MTEEGANSDTTAPGSKDDGREDAGGGPQPAQEDPTPSTTTDPAILALLKYRYSREELLSLREEPLSQRKPDFIDLNEVSPTIWDPTRWNEGNKKKGAAAAAAAQEANENGGSGTAGPPVGSVPGKSAELDHRRRPGDPRERIRKENDGIVLSPQRRSFNSGCFVPVREPRPARPHSPLGPKSEAIIPVREIASSTSSSSRRIGSGRILRDNWDFSDKSDHLNGDNDYNFRPQGGPQQQQRNSQDSHHHVSDQRRSFGGRNNDYNSDIKEKPSRNSRYSGPNRRISNVEQEEPEWFSSGPISQNDTIELRGFDDSERLLSSNTISNNNNNNNVNAKKKMSPSQAKRAREWFKKRSIKEEDDETAGSLEQTGGGGGQAPGARSTPIPQDGSGGAALLSQNGNADSNNDKKKKPHQQQQSETASMTEENSKVNNDQQNYMFEDFLKADSIPGFAGLLTNGIGGDGDSNAGKSRFSKWFSSMEPNHQDVAETRPADDANIMNLLKDLNETSVSIPGDSESYFAPISPAAASGGNAGGAGAAPPPHSKSVSIMEMLQRTKQNESSIKSQVPGKIMNLVELEAKIRHGGGGGGGAGEQLHKQHSNKSEEDMTAFNRLLAHMSGGQGGNLAQKSQPMSLMEMLSHSQQQDEAQARMAAQMLGPTSPGGVPPAAAAAAAQNDIVTRLQHAKQQQQQLDMLTKLINSNMQMRASPLPFDMDVQQGRELLSRPEAQAILQGLKIGDITPQHLYQQLTNHALQPRHREMLCTILKLQGINNGSVGSSGAATAAATAGGATAAATAAASSGGVGPSPRVLSPVPPHPMYQQQQQLRVSPLPNALHQRIPSPRELQVHTQNILQRALIKKKLEEQQENFRKKQEMQQQRGQSPNNNNNNNNITVTAAASSSSSSSSSVQQTSSSKSVSSPTPLAFTPTSVLRKMTAEKDDGKEAKLLLGQGRAVTGMRPNSSQQQQQQQQQVVQQPQPQQAIGQWPAYHMNMKQAGRPIVKANSFQQQQQQQQPDQFFTQQQQQKFLNQLQIQQQQQRKQQQQQQQQQQQYHGGYSMNHHSQYNTGSGFSQQLTQQQLRAQHQQQARPANVPQQQQQQQNQLGFGSGPQQQTGSGSAASWQQLLNRGHGGRGGLTDGDLSPTSNQLTRWFSPDLLERARVGELPSTAGLSQHVPSLEEIERLTAPAVHN